MNLLVACEESQRVCSAFRECGHIVYSSDLKDCSGGYPECYTLNKRTFNGCKSWCDLKSGFTQRSKTFQGIA